MAWPCSRANMARSISEMARLVEMAAWRPLAIIVNRRADARRAGEEMALMASRMTSSRPGNKARAAKMAWPRGEETRSAQTRGNIALMRSWRLWRHAVAGAIENARRNNDRVMRRAARRSDIS